MAWLSLWALGALRVLWALCSLWAVALWGVGVNEGEGSVEGGVA